MPETPPLAKMATRRKTTNSPNASLKKRKRATGVLKIKAKLGELLSAESPAKRGAKGGRGNKKATDPGLIAFSDKSLTAYRKLAANSSRLDEYCESTPLASDSVFGGCAIVIT